MAFLSLHLVNQAIPSRHALYTKGLQMTLPHCRWILMLSAEQTSRRLLFASFFEVSKYLTSFRIPSFSP